MKFIGMSRKVTDIDAPDGMSYFQSNTRMHVDEELQRRYGMSRSSLAPAAGPILGFGATNTPNGPIVGSVVSGGVNGDAGIAEVWHELGMRRPKGANATAAAPSIFSFTPSPTSPPAFYVIGVVTITATVTYDGLSGPLIYSWSTPDAGGGMLALVVVNNANPAIFNFDATCFPGNYLYSLTVTCSGNPALNNTAFGSYTVL